MNNKTWLEKTLEHHKRLTREMLSYVRDCLLVNKLAEEYDKTLHDCDYLRRKLSDDDLLVAEFLIRSGIDVDEINEKLDELYKKDYVCPVMGGFDEGFKPRSR